MIGREKEIHDLRRYYEKKDASLVLITGRLHIGKTYLISTLFQDDFVFRLTGVYHGTKEVQLENFRNTLLRNNFHVKEPIQSWTEAFELLRKYLDSFPKTRRLVVFFDEFPWMDTPKSGFLTAFDYFWNDYGCAKQNLMFIVCGSSSSWIQKKFLQSKGGLYHRQNLLLHIEPFTLRETKQYLEANGFLHLSLYDITSLYMVLGGIPYYLEKLDPALTINENIDSLFFKKDAPLKYEYQSICETLFLNAPISEKILSLLSQKRIGLTRKELISSLKMKENGKISEIMDSLLVSGFIRKGTRYHNKKKETYYSLKDYFLMFYYHFMAKKDIHSPFFTVSYNDPSRLSWQGLTFENIVLDHVLQVKQALGISGVITTEYSFDDTSDDGAQIDLVIDRNDRVIDLCEIKFSSGSYQITKEYRENLLHKIDVFLNETKTKKTLRLVFISTYGLKDSPNQDIISRSLTIEDLFP